MIKGIITLIINIVKRAILLVQKLLTGKKRLPEFDGEWEELTLGDVCSEITMGYTKTPTYVSEGVPFYRSENVTANDFSNVKYITQEAHNKIIKRCCPKKGDILLTKVHPIGHTRFIDWDINASISQQLVLLKLNQKVEVAYVYEYTKSSFFMRDIKSHLKLNTEVPSINLSVVKDVPIRFPKSRDEQLTIAKILSDIRIEIESLEQLIIKKRDIRTVVIQKLLTGKKRLSGFDGEWEELTLGDVCSEITMSYTKTPTYVSEDVDYSISLTVAVVFTVNQKVEVAYVNEYTKSSFFMRDFKSHLKLNTEVPSINLNVVKDDVSVRFPKSRDEQLAIAEILSDMRMEIESLEQLLVKKSGIKTAMMQQLLAGKKRLIKTNKNQGSL